MNGEQKQTSHTSTLDGVHFGQRGRRGAAWRWVVIGELWMLVAFVGMSSLMIAIVSALNSGGGHPPRELLAMGVSGALLILLAGRGMTRLLRRAEYEPEPGLGVRQTTRNTVSTSHVPAPAGSTAVTPAW